MLQPKLADRQNITFKGNKNKTGLFHGESDNIEEPVKNSSLTDKQVLSDGYTFDSNCNEQETQVLHARMQIGPQLAPGKNSLEGNKNGTGFLDGLTCDTSIIKSSHKIFQTCITAEASKQVATDVFQSVLDGNCSLNNLQKIQCDNDCMEVHVNHKHYNVVKNSEHDFGFCPLTELVLYKGGPVHWDRIPDDLQPYEFIKKTGKPNFLSARIPVRSQLNIDKWREHLDQYFIDRSVPFGYRNGSQIFQRCSDAIRFTMQQHGFPHLFNYIDDLIYTGLPSNIHASFRFLLKLLQDLGLDISRKKLVAPDTTVTCLGIQIDTVTRTLSIPHKKLQEIASICKSWVTKTYCSKKALQSLLGSLLYITKCVKPARIFLNRMLALLRDNHNVQKILLNQAFFQDLTWFNTFLSSFNGVTYYDHQLPSAQVHLDACLTGLGGHFDSMVYAFPEVMNDICQLEMVNIVVALKIWANHWKNKRIHVFCDNVAVVQVLNTGKARDSILATCARNVWLIAAMFNIELKFSHISGKTNVIADLLSRWSMVPDPHEKLKKMLPQYKWVDSHLYLTALNHAI